MNRIAIIDGYRTAAGKAGGYFKNVSADNLAAKLLREIIIKTNFDVLQIDEVIFGNVSQPANAANIARIIALKAGIPESVPAFTVHRNCASGMEALTTAASKIRAGELKCAVVGGVESMSNIPFLFNKKITEFFIKLAQAKTLIQKLKILTTFRLSFLKPIIAIEQGLTDPVADMIMGKTAEILAREFQISRQEQDEFSLKSHQKSAKAIKDGTLAEEIIPIFNNNKQIISEDEGIRKNQSIADLKKLKPYFEKGNGTVTVGNSSQLTDAACAMIVMSEKEAKKQKLDVLGYLTDFSYAGLEPERMGLGPVYATSKLLDKTKLSFENIDLFEINEAFAAQAIACQKAFASNDFAKKYLNKNKAIGQIDNAKLNVNGGAISIGHPVGMTGARIVLHLLRELKRQKKQKGIASLCIGGGQGGACLLEVD